jgi:hypothetical protein
MTARITPRALSADQIAPPDAPGPYVCCNNTRLSWKAETHAATCQSIVGRRE